MKQPSNLRVSSYVNYFPLPGDKFVCLVHGYSSAVDLVDEQLSERMGDGDITSSLSNPDIASLLTTRGYLTTRSVEEEKVFFSQINELFLNRQSQFSFNQFEIHLASPTNDQKQRIAEPGFIENIFLAISEIRGIDTVDTVRLNLIGATRSGLDATERILDQARDWDFKVEIVATESQIEIIAPKLKKHLVTRLSILIDNPTDLWLSERQEGALDPPYSDLLEIIRKEVRLDCLVVIDALTKEQLSAFFNNVRNIRRRLRADAQNYIVVVPATEKADSSQAVFINNNLGLYPMRLDEFEDYRQVESYVWSRKMVRLRPYYSQLPRFYKICATGEIFLTEGFDQRERAIGSIRPDGYSFSAPDAAETTGISADGECASCVLSLLCGGNCNVRQPHLREHYKQKIARLLTIPVANMV